MSTYRRTRPNTSRTARRKCRTPSNRSAIPEQMAAHGATVVVSDLDPSRCEQAARRLRDAGHTAHAVACDVSRRSAIEAMVDAVQVRCDRIDVLVCNAGVQGPAGPIGE